MNKELEKSHYEEGGDSDADAFAIIAIIIIIAVSVVYFLSV